MELIERVEGFFWLVVSVDLRCNYGHTLNETCLHLMSNIQQ